jgi:biotin transport system substrate-specific component
MGCIALGMGVIYAFGFSWLAFLIGPAKALTAGIAPFVLGDVLKVLLATALVLGALRGRTREA